MGDFSSNLRDGSEHSPCIVDLPEEGSHTLRRIRLSLDIFPLSITGLWSSAIQRCGRLGLSTKRHRSAYPPPSQRRHLLVSLGVYPNSVGAPLFLRLFGGHDPKFRLILHLFHFRYGTILPCSVPGSGYRLRADHPLSMSRFPCRSYDADDSSVVTSPVPDSTIGGVCSIGSKDNERLTLNPQGIGGMDHVDPGSLGPRQVPIEPSRVRVRTQQVCQRVHRRGILPFAEYFFPPPH